MSWMVTIEQGGAWSRFEGEGGSRLVHIREGVDMYHVLGEVVGPFEDLGLDVHKEGVGGPPSHHFDLLHRDIH